MTTRAEKRAEAQKKATELRAHQARQSRRNKILAVTGVLVLIALVAFAVAIIIKDGHSKQASVSATTTSTTQEWADFVRAESVFPEKLPANVNDHGGISLGSNMEAGTVNKGAPAVTIYYDYMCSWCNYLESQYSSDLTQMATNGDITLVYQPVAVIGDEFSIQAAAAEFYVAEHAPKLYAAFHDALFMTTIPVFLTEDYVGNQPSLENITATAAVVGMSDEEVNKLSEAVTNGTYDTFVESANEQWRANGQQGTPGVLIDDRQLVDWTDGKLLEYASEAAR